MGEVAKLYKSPLNWYGGKYYQAKDIIGVFPRHKIYCEVFGGAGHILFRKEPSEIDIYNDIHSGLYLFFKVLRDQDMSDKLITQIQLTPYSRGEFDKSKDWMYGRRYYRASKKVLCNDYAVYRGYGGGWSYTKSNSRRGMSQAVSRWLGNVDENMINLIERLREIQIENLDFRDCIKNMIKDTLFYLDPPYIHETRV